MEKSKANGFETSERNPLNHHYLGRGRRGEGTPIAGVLIIVIIAVGGFAWFYHIGPFATQSSVPPSGGVGGNSGTPCATTNAWVPQAMATHYTGAASLSSPAILYYTPSAGGLIQDTTNSPGTGKTDGITYTSVSASAPASQPFMVKASATGSYDLWASFGQAVSTYGVSQYTISCVPTASNSAAYNWFQGITLFNASKSGTSATTFVKGLVIASSGSNLAGTAGSYTTMPTASQQWNAQLLIKGPGAAGMIPTTEYGTVAKPVTNYATGQVTNSGPVQFGGVVVISTNKTDISVSLDPSAPAGTILQPVTGNTLTAASKAWVLSGFPGCGPTAGSVSAASPFICVNLPVDVYQTDSGKSGHVAIEFTFIDGQLASYILQNLVNPALTDDDYQTPGATAAIFDTYSGITVPTTGTDAGAPTSLIQQTYNCILASA